MEHSIVVQESNRAEEFSNVVASLKKRYKQKTPKSFKKEFQGKGNKTYTYVEREYVVLWLNETYGDKWSFEASKEISTIGDHVSVLVTLTLQEQTGVIRKISCYGSREAIPSSNGRPVANQYVKGAETDGLKRCAAMLGCAADVYAEEYIVDTTNQSIADPDIIAWFARCMPILVEQFPPNKLVNLPKQFTALSEGKLTKEQIIQNYAKLNITLEP